MIVTTISEFVSLVKRMREAQKYCDAIHAEIKDETKRVELLWEAINDSFNLETEVDKWLEKYDTED